MRLVDADALKKEMETAWMYAVDMYTACAVIDNAPTVDAVPVRRGKWVKYPSTYRCSNCGNPKRMPKPYCELCGARMEVDEDGYQV
jgi:hypothetical protein